MRTTLAIALAIVAAPALAGQNGYDVQLPPAFWDAPSNANVIMMSPSEVDKECRRRSGVRFSPWSNLACADTNRNEILVPRPEDVGQKCADALLRHEHAHIFGWPESHVGAGVARGVC